MTAVYVTINTCSLCPLVTYLSFIYIHHMSVFVMINNKFVVKWEWIVYAVRDPLVL